MIVECVLSTSLLFFKQKTAYEMRISDWCSDVCSSDLLDAVVGLKGTVEKVNGVDTLTRVGTTCALCHSTVDDSFAPGIGHRRDGWPNLDLNPGAIIALSPALSDAQKAQLNSWGPGKYDPRWNVDGLSVPDRKSNRLNSSHYCASRMQSSA